MKNLANTIIRVIERRVCQLTSDVKNEIKGLVTALDEVEPIDLAMEISGLDYFEEAGLDLDIISVVVEETINEFKDNNTDERVSLKDIIIKNSDNEISSNALIRSFTKEVVNGGYSEKEIYEAQHFIKDVVKSEVVSDLDKQIDTFKHFLKQR